MLQKELAKRLRARYDTKMNGNGWLEVSSDGIVHLLYPQHLVILFKFFGYIFFFGNFFYQLKEHIVRLFIISAICELSLPLVSRL